jgi:hypothetical protein
MITQRAREERRDPEAVDAQPLQVVELLDQTAEVAGAVGVRVAERAHEHLVEDRGLEPLRGPAGAVVGDLEG